MMAERNKIADFTMKLCKFFYYCGLPNQWTDGFNTKLFNRVQNLITLCLCIFNISQWISFRTQTQLSEKQTSDRNVFSFCHTLFLCYYFNVVYYKNEIVNLLHKLCITLKQVYNNPQIEQATIRKNTFYATAYFSTVIFVLISHAFNGIQEVLRADGTFITVITSWPEVKDTSLKANVFRVIIYVVWCIFLIRSSAVYVTVISITIIISNQYKNLQSYFYSLNDLYDDIEVSIQQERERREKLFEESFKIGVKLHYETLCCELHTDIRTDSILKTRQRFFTCVKQCQKTFNAVFVGQILTNVLVLSLLMIQMVNSERTLTNVCTIMSSSAAVLISTGFLMWNAGDITTEAALLPYAIFYSGWHRYRGKAASSIKKMTLIAIRQSQKPVCIRSFGIIELSYESYLAIVKSSYSAFSLLY